MFLLFDIDLPSSSFKLLTFWWLNHLQHGKASSLRLSFEDRGGVVSELMSSSWSLNGACGKVRYDQELHFSPEGVGRPTISRYPVHVFSLLAVLCTAKFPLQATIC